MVAAAVVFLTMAILSGYCAGLGVLPPGPVNGTLGGNVIFKTTINPTTLIFIAWTFGAPPVSIVNFASSDGTLTGEGYVGRISLDNSTGSLELRKLTLNDSGTFRVSLRKAGVINLGSTSLNVYEPISGATITTSPNPPIIEGNSVTLTCDASGSIISREWMMVGQPLYSGDNIIFSENNRVLFINSANRTDSGEYLCGVSNPVSSKNASDTVNVIYGPDGMEIKGPTEIEVGQKFTLTCSADSNPPANYTWMLNGTEIPGHSPEFPKEKSEYSDSGDYTCTATNDVTRIKTSEVHKLSVKVEGSLSPDGLSSGAIAGIVFGGLLVVGVAVGVSVFFLRKNGTNADPVHQGGSQQHVYANPSPVYENTRQNQSPPLPLTDSKNIYDTRIM
ncbi:carcinoembryonic antigen-related cell adhesion molecule 1-like isoform X2 [Coregonus clupeaformis]|nr:carcinoembryonic antigen-related cell adhesion molecule 1-like isoform X2 [Coregonus clupeaformis]